MYPLVYFLEMFSRYNQFEILSGVEKFSWNNEFNIYDDSVHKSFACAMRTLSFNIS